MNTQQNSILENLETIMSLLDEKQLQLFVEEHELMLELLAAKGHVVSLYAAIDRITRELPQGHRTAPKQR